MRLEKESSATGARGCTSDRAAGGVKPRPEIWKHKHDIQQIDNFPNNQESTPKSPI